MSKELSKKIVVLNFIMTLAMIMYHNVVLDSSFAINSIDKSINTFIYHIHEKVGVIAMCYFFTVTGFLLFRNYTLKEYPKKIKRRVFSLLVPYIFWQCIITIIDIIQKQYTFTANNFIRITFCLDFWPRNGAMWYVYAIFLLALASPILLILYKNKTIAMISIVILIVLIAVRGKISNGFILKLINHGVMQNIMNYLPCYLIGTFYGKFSKEDTNNEILKYVIYLYLISICLDCFVSGLSTRVIFWILPMILLFVVPFNKVFEDKKICKYSFLLYAIHQPLIGDLWQILFKYFKVQSLPISLINLFTILIVFAIDFLIAIIIHSTLKRLCPKALDILTGGRV